MQITVMMEIIYQEMDAAQIAKGKSDFSVLEVLLPGETLVLKYVVMVEIWVCYLVMMEI